MSRRRRHRPGIKVYVTGPAPLPDDWPTPVSASSASIMLVTFSVIIVLLLFFYRSIATVALLLVIVGIQLSAARGS